MQDLKLVRVPEVEAMARTAGLRTMKTANDTIVPTPLLVRVDGRDTKKRHRIMLDSLTVRGMRHPRLEIGIGLAKAGKPRRRGQVLLAALESGTRQEATPAQITLKSFHP